MASELVKIAADFSTTLVTKVAVGATTATLTSATDDDGVALPAGTYGFTIDRNSANKEYFTAVLSGTSLTGIKTVTRGTGVGTSGFALAHRKGAEVIISDHVALKRMLDLLDGTTDLDSTNPFMYDGTATISDAKHIATKAYVDGVAIAGAPDASTTVKGIVKLTAAPTSATDPIAVGDNDTRVPTQGENDALTGTSGTPSSTNKYVTNDDTSSTTSASKVYRLKSNGKIDATMLDGNIPAIDGSAILNVGNVSRGTATKATGSGTGTQNITHGLSVAPRIIKITAISESGTNLMMASWGNATGTSAQGAIYMGWAASGANSGSHGVDTSNIISLNPASGGPIAIANISAISASTFTLNWTTFSPPDQVEILWEVYA